MATCIRAPDLSSNGAVLASSLLIDGEPEVCGSGVSCSGFSEWHGWSLSPSLPDFRPSGYFVFVV